MSGKICLEKAGKIGTTRLNKGDYFVSVNVHSREFRISGNGVDVSIQGIRKQGKKKYKVTEVVFYSGGGKTWSLVAKVPPHFELLTYIHMD